MKPFVPAYINAFQSGLLEERIKIATDCLKSCTLCPRACKVNRLNGETGICKTGKYAWVSGYDAHFGEEAPLVGSHGSGTIFFTHCNLRCNFCQNYEISHLGQGQEVSDDTLAHIMISLQNDGCHNINLVTPSHVVPQILSALKIAIGKGLSIPLVYNSSAYDSHKTLKLLDGVIDIYMPDAKFFDSKVSEITCKSTDYPLILRASLTEMYRQVGDLKLNESNIAVKGLLVRHLVLPERLAGTAEIMTFISQNISKNTYVNVMPQYRPCGKADKLQALSRRISQEEFLEAIDLTKKAGITRLDNAARKFMLIF